MHIVVGYIPTPEGLAAVEYATTVAERESAAVTVVNTGMHGNDSDPSFAEATELDAIDDGLAADHHRRRLPGGDGEASPLTCRIMHRPSMGTAQA